MQRLLSAVLGRNGAKMVGRTPEGSELALVWPIQRRNKENVAIQSSGPILPPCWFRLACCSSSQAQEKAASDSEDEEEWKSRR